MAQTVQSLPPMWDTWMDFWTLGLGLAPNQLFWTLSVNQLVADLFISVIQIK